MYTKKPVSPCYYHKDCEHRGTKICHTDDCPYGWKEFQDIIQANREFRVSHNKLMSDIDYVKKRNKSH